MDNLWIIYGSGWWLRYTYPSEKDEFVIWDDEIPNIWKNEKCSKPPTSHQNGKHIPDTHDFANGAGYDGYGWMRPSCVKQKAPNRLGYLT